MGQGHYCALGFGVLDPELPDSCENPKGYADLMGALDRAAGRRVRDTYESPRAYLAIFVAENAGVDDESAVPETCLLSEAAQGEHWERAKEAWQRVRAASEAFGVSLAEGQALLIVDYD